LALLAALLRQNYCHQVKLLNKKAAVLIMKPILTFLAPLALETSKSVF
jgi:hypothetical protein